MIILNREMILLDKRQEVTEFLQQFKTFQTKKLVFFGNRKINIDTLTYLGLTVKDIEENIQQLTYKNYCSGPEDDRDNPGHKIWEFGVEISIFKIYIKLSDDFSFNYAKCISFHIPKYELEFPLK
ncbi:MAG: hypothetical protein ABII64_05755 [Elusimicrobiota bacterium]